MRVEEGAVVLNGHGSGHRDVRVALDGSITEVAEPKTISRYRGAWKDGTFEYEVEFERVSGRRLRWSIRDDPEELPPHGRGLLVSVVVDPPVVKDSVGLYRHAEDIAMPAPAKAAIGDLAWLAGAWVGTRSSGSSIEERWSPPLGGAMLAVSRTVNTSGKMVAFEYLRIVEREGGLVYIAQPGGKTPTEFVLTELARTRAVFDNPRHDYPKRIVYELSAEGGLSATIGQMKGGTPRRFDFKREGRLYSARCFLPKPMAITSSEVSSGSGCTTSDTHSSTPFSAVHSASNARSGWFSASTLRSGCFCLSRPTSPLYSSRGSCSALIVSLYPYGVSIRTTTTVVTTAAVATQPVRIAWAAIAVSPASPHSTARWRLTCRPPRSIPRERSSAPRSSGA
jgi:hypothetical protein